MRLLLFSISILIIGTLSACTKNVASPAPTPLLDAQLADDLTIKEIVTDVFVVEHRYPWPANSLLVKVSDDAVVFVDTPYTDDATQAVLDWVRSTLGDVQITEINTGYHVDNLGGNRALLDAGIPLYGSSLTARLLLEKGETTRSKLLEWLTGPENAAFLEAHKSIRYTAPNQLFDIAEGQTVSLVDPSVEVFFPGPSHAEDNLVVYFKKQRVLFGGCMVKAGDAENLGFTGDADVASWPEAVARVMENYPDAKIVVPGHGAPSDRTLLAHTLSLLDGASR